MLKIILFAVLLCWFCLQVAIVKRPAKGDEQSLTDKVFTGKDACRALLRELRVPLILRWEKLFWLSGLIVIRIRENCH